MSEIKCPHCGQSFQLDEADYAAILQQVRSKEFDREVNARAEDLHKMLEAQQKEALLDVKSKNQQVIADKEKEIADLKSQLKNADVQKELAVTKAVQSLREEKMKLESDLQHEKDERISHDREVETQHKRDMDMKDEVIAHYRDFKARESTKMIGESLEQHCLTEFNKVRMGSFPRAYFDKDNDASSGSKGDFIFRESTEDGVEFISIMFEMKNEMETTASKHKNADFFKELDKDRREKNCEYAVLVSLLEAEDEVYNTGIVDVSYVYPKMYVIRPQFLIPMITLLRNAALNSVTVRRELEAIREQNIDVSHFESDMMEFKDKFSKNYESAHKQFNAAIEEIDKSIDHLQKVRESLTKSDYQLRLANDKADSLSIKKLVKNNPTMRDKFLEAGADLTK